MLKAFRLLPLLAIPFSSLSSGTSNNSLVTVAVNQVENNFDIHTELQQQYLNSADHTVLPTGVGGTSELSKTRDIVVSFDVTNSSELPIDNYYVDLSESSDFSSYKRVTTEVKEASFSNLKVGTDYYYRVTANLGSESVTSDVKTFKTKDSNIRNLSIDGVTNVRDLGGKSVSGNKRIKQGLIFRNARFNASYQEKTAKEFTDEGLRQIKEYMNIKTEIDLRRVDLNEPSYISKSVLGSDVNYYSCSMKYEFNNTFFDVNKAAIKAAFNVFANQEMYPVSFHCHIGTDRTGGLSLLLLGLLGASDVDIETDYLFSNFGNIEGSRDVSRIRNDFNNYFNAYVGDTLSTRIRNYLLSIGIQEYKIDAFLNIMLENK